VARTNIGCIIVAAGAGVNGAGPRRATTHAGWGLTGGRVVRTMRVVTTSLSPTDELAPQDPQMSKHRLEAFSDGVIAILITIMVLELHPPEHGAGLAALGALTAVFLGYVLSFVYLAIYWNNHHHLFQIVEQVDGRVLWANLHLLFWLSLVPFTTAWMGRTGFAVDPVIAYGVVLLMAAVAYFILTRALLALHAPGSALARALGRDVKGKMSLAMYTVAIALATWLPWAAGVLYVVVAVIWLAPDRRIERLMQRIDG